MRRTVAAAAMAVVAASTAWWLTVHAAPAPSQQWITAVGAATTGVGTTTTATFGTTGVTATVSVDSFTGAVDSMFWPGPQGRLDDPATVGGGLNVPTFIEPDNPTPSASILNGMSTSVAATFAQSFTLNKPLIAPILHVVNLDGSTLTVGGTTTTGVPIALTTLSSNNAMEVSGNLLNTTIAPPINWGCQANNGTNENGACGSFRLGSGSQAIQAFTLSNAINNNSDGWLYSVSFPTTPLTKAFNPSTITAGQLSQLSLSITNPNESQSIALSPLDFTDTLPAGVTIASATATNNGSCGSPTITNGSGGGLAVGDTSIRATNISLAPGATCTIAVTVSASAGSYTNAASNVSSTVGNVVPTGSATLTVNAEPPCNLATNGSFEEPSIQGDPNNPEPGTQYTNGWAVYRTTQSTLDGWAIVAGTVDILRYFNNSSQGSQSIDLWGTAPSVIQQTFTGLVPGAEYTFSVDYSGLNTVNSTAEVQLDNGGGFQLIETLSPVANAVSNGSMGLPDTPSFTVTWATFTHTFVAAGTEATIRFDNQDAPSDFNTGLFIDNFAFGGAASCPPRELPGDVFPTCPINQQPPPTDFTIQQRWATPNVAGQRTLPYQTPVVGDLFGTGEIVAVVASDNAFIGNTVAPTATAKDLRIFRGSDGALLRTITTPIFNWFGHSVVAIADVDGDGQGEIIMKASHADEIPVAQRGRLFAYRNDGTQLWVSNVRYDYANDSANTNGDRRSGHSLGIADFNGDGVPEVYIGSQIFNARTGVRLAARPAANSAGCVQGCIQGATVAVDMDDDGLLELVAGNVIYKVNITNTAGAAGNSMPIWRQAAAVPFMGDGWSAVADLDLDGDPDVVVVRAPGGADPEARLFVWDGQTGTVLGAATTGVGTSGAEPLIGDIDGDGNPEIVFVTGNQLNAFDFVPGTGLVRKWGVATNDASGQTSFALFDFNSDGNKELVYRDEQNVRIIDGSGTTAVDLATFPCLSGTRAEMPVVAALDSSGEARILVTCGFGAPGSTPDFNAVGSLRAYETASFPWANARPVWNQQTYFVTHVNDDLTIAAAQFPHWISFNDPDQLCSAGISRPLNAFQQQVGDLDATTGCPVLCPIPAEVTVTKTADPPDVLIPGGTITYTVTANNAGPGAAANTVVRDPFPAGIASATWTCAASGGAICPAASGGPVTPPGDMLNETVATFPANSALTYTILATVEPTPPARITNTASATGPVLLCQPGNTPPPCDATVIVPRPAVELVITKTSAPKPAIPGQALTYTISVVNNGPDTATDARVQDAMPPALAGFTWMCAQPAGECTPATGTGAVDTLVDLAPGATATITLTGTLAAGHLGALTNVATVTVPPGFEGRCPAENPSCRETTDENVPVPTADITVVKTPPTSIQRGGTAIYTLAVTNNGPSDAQAVTLADPTPAGLVFVEAGAPCAGGFPCALGPMMVGATVNLPVTLRVPPEYAGPAPIVNRACASSEAADPDTANSCSETTTPLVEVSDLQVTKTVDNSAPSVGGTVRFTITVQNNGPSQAVNVALVDQLPAGLTFVSASPSQGTFDPATGRWAIGTIANAAAATLTIDATVTSSGPLANLATITETDTFDPDTSNNTTGSAINVDTAADLQVHKTVDATTVGIGATVTYTITVRNAGPDAAPAVEVSDPLPVGLTLVSATPSAGTYDPATGVWAVGALANGGAATLQVTATLTVAEVVINTAQITGNPPYDPAPPNNSSGTTINGVGADLQVVKTAERTTAAVGERITFTIVVTNNGPGEATGVQVRESLPPGLIYISSSATQGIYVPETGLWTVGTLTPPTGSAAHAVLTVVADVTASGVHANLATIAGQDQPDPTPSNDVSGVEVESTIADLEAGLTFIGDADAVGRLFDFFVTVTNRGSQPTSQPLIVAIPFPREVSFTAPTTTWPCEAVGRTLFCEHALDAPLPPDVGRTLTYWSEVAQVFPRGLAAYAHTVSAFDDNVRNNVGGALLTPPPGHTPDLQVTQAITTSASGAGQTVVYRAEVTNLGDGPATDVTLIDVLPAGLTLVSIDSEAGSCAGTGRLACALGDLAPQQRVGVTITARTTGSGLIGHTVSVSGREVDPDLTNNAARTTFTLPAVFDPLRDTDGDGMTDVWESAMGLDPASNDGAADPDGDGQTNAQEAVAGTHPRGFYKQYFAEGVANAFFDTAFDLLNVDATREAAVLSELMADSGAVTALPMRLAPLGRQTGDAADMLPGRTGAFSTLIESDRPLATDRLTTWDATGYGTGLESGLSAPSARWFFAEGATNIFGLFYLLQNPHMTTAAEVSVRYLLASGAPITQTYTVPPHSRLTIPVNEVPGLASVDVSAEITASHPIVAERAMYLSSPTAVFDAGHVGAGATSTSPTWFFAEGATGSFFDLYLLLANPNPSPADVTVQYQLPDGRVVSKTYTVAAAARRTINVKDEDAALLATSVAMAVSASQPIVAERSMWWPTGAWQEAHVVLGATTTGTRWAVAGGMIGGPRAESFYALIANQAPTAGQVRVTAIFDDRTRRVQVLDLPPTSRTTVDVAATFPDAAGRRVSLLIESLGATPLPLVVEGSRYSSADGRLWSAGGAMLGTRLQ